MKTVVEMLKYGGVNPNARIKLARHKDDREGLNLDELVHSGMFEVYQSYQERDVFKDCDYIVSFVGEEHNQALLVGVYEVLDREDVQEVPKEIQKHFGPEAKKNSAHRYNLKKLSEFKDFEKRLVFEWSIGSRPWFRILNEKTNIKISQWKPEGYVADFTGYDDVILSYIELEKIINNPLGNNRWKDQLSSAKGVYLILDRHTGSQYVGSATGIRGFWGRWSDYARNGHGGNEKLIDIVESDKRRKYDFQFSILKVVASTTVYDDIIKEETKYKRKLGTRVFGLNPN